MKTEFETSLLFKIARGEKIRCIKDAATPEYAVGNRVASTPYYRSRYNVANSPITVTCVAEILDELLVDKNICAYMSPANKQVYCEIEGAKIACDGKTLWTDTDIGPRRNFQALCLWKLAFEDASANELSTTVESAITTFKREKKVNADDIFRLCDSFYYTMIKGHESYQSDDLVIEPYEAAMRTGELEEIPALNGADLCDCTLGKPKKKKLNAVSSETAFTEMYTKEDCISGKFTVPYDWSEESKSYIPDRSLLKKYVPTEEYYKLLNKMTKRLTERVVPRINTLKKTAGEDYNRLEAIGDDYINVTLCGKPGTGKSIMVHALAATLGLPIYVINNSQNTDEDEYEGKTKMVAGKPTAVPTDVVRAFKNGGICLLEEINLPQAAVVMGALGQAVEFPFILKEDGYKPIRRHPLCVFVSTMNTGTAGSKTVSQPFANRFKQSLRIKDPAKNEFIKILQSRTGENKRLCTWVYQTYDKLVNAVNENPMADVDSILMTLSMRTCIGAIENIQEGYEPKEAIKDSIIGKIAETDLTVAESCLAVLDSTIPQYRA